MLWSTILTLALGLWTTPSSPFLLNPYPLDFIRVRIWFGHRPDYLSSDFLWGFASINVATTSLASSTSALPLLCERTCF